MIVTHVTQSNIWITINLCLSKCWFYVFRYIIVIFIFAGNKQQLKETFNIAFLNGDDRREIKWVHNMSTMLERKYDIKCCILAEEYLHGFPLKRKLGHYFNTFQAVIISLTKENYEQYDFYIEDDMPVIAVELDYVREIRSNLRKYPYINCTTCEHLWFPKFLDTLRTLLPG